MGESVGEIGEDLAESGRIQRKSPTKNFQQWQGDSEILLVFVYARYWLKKNPSFFPLLSIEKFRLTADP